ncbi:hypothetical protein CAC42_1185 [Sphaceloma murrayae]|uniref:Anaphase-promoting complex subunit 1 N-terminal domain-containing protein n=1 Tax=Sphaceloma murrayae TaxID=2082308 RepID=A0A2K1R293_9PEZI|nr:hypothetical protein CAC42_1185 [Sphaceloma murrayae]
MAEVVSFGVHAPTALQYLVSEGALPHDPSEDLYQSNSYSSTDNHADEEEEVLWTRNRVVYSRGGYIQRVYNYPEHGEDVQSALVTCFRAPVDGIDGQESTSRQKTGHTAPYPDVAAFGRVCRKSRRSSVLLPTTNADTFPDASPVVGVDRTRALVILVGKQCHVHFLAGSSHIVSLPFVVASIFPAQDGIVVQRSIKFRPGSSGTVPVVPPNSFISSQPQLSPPLRSPFASGRGIPNVSAAESPSLKHISALSAFTEAASSAEDYEAPHLWSLTDPLADFSAIASATVAPLPRHLRIDDAALFVEYDDIDAAESLLYVSPRDEVPAGPSAGKVALLVFVTMNEEFDQVTVWQAWYLRPRPLSTLTAVRKTIKEIRSKRRASGNTAILNTGGGPSVRFHDKGRESFAAAANVPVKRKSGRREKVEADAKSVGTEAEDMASRMDPDFRTSQQHLRDTRRAGSVLPRVDPVSEETSRARSGVGPHTATSRRGPSMRLSQDRRSFGTSIYRKSRGSVPGSVFSKSIGPEDDSMEIESEAEDGELDAEIARVSQLFLATHEFASVDATFSSGADGVKPELLLRKMHVFQLSTSHSSSQGAPAMHERFKTRTLCRASTGRENGTFLSVWICDKMQQQVTKVDFDIALAPITTIGQDSAPSRSFSIPVPIFRSQKSETSITDVVKIADGPVQALASSSVRHGLTISPDRGTPCSIALPQKHYFYDPVDVRNDLHREMREFGIRRTLNLVNPPTHLSDLAKSGHLYAIDDDRHRFALQVKLRPADRLVAYALQIAHTVLSGVAKDMLMQIWASAYQHLRSEDLSSDDADLLELEALIITLFSFAVGSLGRGPSSRSRRSHAGNQQASEPFMSRQASVMDGATSRMARPWRAISIALAEPTTTSKLDRAEKMMALTSVLDQIRMTDMEAKARSLLHRLKSEGNAWLMDPKEMRSRTTASLQLILALQLFREELRLNAWEDGRAATMRELLAAALAQMGHYLRQDAWDWKLGTRLLGDIGFTNPGFSDSDISEVKGPARSQVAAPFSIDAWLERALADGQVEQMMDLRMIAKLANPDYLSHEASLPHTALLSRQVLLARFLENVSALRRLPAAAVEVMQQNGMSSDFIESLPDSTAVLLKEMVSRCQSSPPSTWSSALLHMVDREDLVASADIHHSVGSQSSAQPLHGLGAVTDVQSLINAAERLMPSTRSHEADRHAIIAQIFSEDRRFVDAARLTNSAVLQIAECPLQTGWSDEDHLEQQKKVMNWVMIRTIALPAGSAMVHFESQKPLISEKFTVPGFSTLCQMKPMDNTVSADKTGFTEEKLSWSFFHAGASAGLHISRKASGIDTSWIVYNKPEDLTNRHAGFLLALGLNGHLRNMAKWLAFKYLTPKHTMTSIGLLLGLSASYMGTMDSLITRMLSVHVTRMLPPGAAELNVSPLTQAVGLLGIGLLYFSTQHRRMSEIMLSELEYRDNEDPASAADNIRDESYRLAAGFSLGLINLGKGADLRGLQGMGLLERLLSIAIGPRPVELVHVVDRATAGATIALAFIYMKTNDKAIAHKIDVPDTTSQLDHIRPDILLLRALARNLIMWDSVVATSGWIHEQLPAYASHYFAPKTSKLLPLIPLRSSEIPLYNIITGHAWSLALKHAGTASVTVRDEILAYLDVFWSTSLEPAAYYDAQLARTTIRRCIDMLVLSAATVMAGTGDVTVFRYLRRLHGRTDAETTYGSHMAAHLAVGTLFVGGGTYTFSTSNIAVAGLVMAFYPLWPSEVLDNAVHLQALRHLWVLAAEARCVVCQDVDSGRPIQLDLKIKLRGGEEVVKKAPCLLPELDMVASVETVNAGWWRAKLDFQGNEKHLQGFRESQILWVRKAPATEENPGLFGRALKGLNEKHDMPEWWTMWASLLDLPALEGIEEGELGLAIPSTAVSGVHEDGKGTVLDAQLSLLSDAKSWDPQKLWNVRLLLGWAERTRLEESGPLKWLGEEFVRRLNGVVQQRMEAIQGRAL